jgi:hypothetical protein
MERFLRHVRRGWERVRANAGERAAALRWLREHPSGWPRGDELWAEALAGRGPLAEWMAAGSSPDAWPEDTPLHSVLASHPFACLSQWSIRETSIRS